MSEETRKLSTAAQHLMFGWLIKRGAMSDCQLKGLMDEAAKSCEAMGIPGWLETDDEWSRDMIRQGERIEAQDTAEHVQEGIPFGADE